jgi:hypothetical protein
MLKKCNKCNLEKPLCDFHLNQNGKDGLHSQCKECKNNYKMEYNKANQDKRQIYRDKNKHVSIWRSVLKTTLKRFTKEKEDKTIKLLGYSALDLKTHLESLFTENMSWDNHGEWHVDHIKDVSSFDINTHPSIVNSLSNLRPMWATSRVINGVYYEGNLNRNKIRRKRL